jgi:hypothetical protein
MVPKKLKNAAQPARERKLRRLIQMEPGSSGFVNVEREPGFAVVGAAGAAAASGAFFSSDKFDLLFSPKDFVSGF